MLLSMLGTMMQVPLTLTAILERTGRLFGGVEIVSRLPDRGLHRTNYAAVCRRARNLAAALAGAGLERGDRVGTLMWNHAWHLEAYFGVPASGCVLHTLNLRLHPDELAYILNHAEDRVLIIDDVLLPLFEKFRDRVRLDRVIVVGSGGGVVPDPYDDYETFLTRAAPDYRLPQPGENDAAAMCYTSGTTGRPKGVVYSHRALLLHSLAISLPDCFSLSQSGSLLAAVPMFHANAWGCPYAAAMVGMKQVLPGPHLDAASLLDLMAREKVTRAAGVPTVWLNILDLLDKQPGRWTLQPDLLVAVGGAAAPASMLKAFDRHGIAVRHAWGMTEITPVGTVSVLRSDMMDLPAETRVEMRARQGVPLPFIEIRAMLDDTEVPWDGQSMGELQVRGPWVAASYHNFPAQDGWTADGWFRTGDVVTIDPDGYMKIMDRTKDLIKSGGEWISSVDLENALMGHESVREAAVIAVAHPKWGERPLAAVVLREGSAITEGELQAYLAKSFSPWQLPDAIVFVPEIPKTSVGKFQKSRLRAMFAGWTWPESAAVSP
jgi:fatty-acyl-CoA synthase